MARLPLRAKAGPRQRAHPHAVRHRRGRLFQARRRSLPQGRLPHHHDHHAARRRRPEEVETEISDKVEEAVNTIAGIDELRSASSEGISLVFVTFTLDKDGDVAAQEVRDRINGILPQLPKGIEQPTVTKLDPDAAPIIYISLVSERPIRESTEIADKLVRRQIENISGVGQVVLLGGRAVRSTSGRPDRPPRQRPDRGRRPAGARRAERAGPRRRHRDGPTKMTLRIRAASSRSTS